jgi:carbamoyl-phosphate synthase large subunit
MINYKKASLILEDGQRFEGFSFGSENATAGEIVFNTAMTGYPESLTDPSYRGQILVLTYPSVGNYGVPGKKVENNMSKFFESENIHVNALIISDYSEKHHHWNASQSLGQWLKEETIPGIFGIDTRMLTKIIREKGSMLAKIVFDDDIPFFDPNKINLVAEVSINKKQIYGNGKHKILLIDCGVKSNIIRYLLNFDTTVIRVPWNYDYSNEEYDGLFISNGPGNPEMCDITIKNLKKSIDSNIPTIGICLGHQLLALAAGATTYKLKFGHRSHNQPVLEKDTNNAYLTSQNHGFAVSNESIPDDWKIFFTNLNDGSNEGLKHKTKPIFTTQFHPEASSGPTDTAFLFDEFIKMIQESKNKIPNQFNKVEEFANTNQISKSQTDKNIKKVLILGSGALKIGEAGEFDYSGSQALKALKEEGIKTVLINPNIATVQTSEEIADEIYFLPVTPYFVKQIIEKEKPEGIMLAFGGQTALNCGVELFKEGIFEKYNIKVLGTPVKAIMDTEDREIFANNLRSIDVDTPKSIAVTSIEDAIDASSKIGFPIIVRAAFTLGGQGSGFCNNEEELKSLASKAFSYSSQILVEESLKGWKEVEYEVVRDKYDNCITVCNMENFDPLGIHTGESIVIAPSQTLTNSEYHKLRRLSIKIVKSIGIVGECNVQYALDPHSEDYRVIEVNARLSRSSALASKATGYPLAFVAAKLGLGYGLHELKNSVTKTTTAFFEPALDYLVCKIPRWDLTKFIGVSTEIGSSMKSVGEVMAIGRSFEEVIQKGLRMIGLGMHGFVGNKEYVVKNVENELSNPTDKRIFVIAEAYKNGWTVEEVYEKTKIDIWFLEKLKNIHDTEIELNKIKNLNNLNSGLLLKAKQQGFSDFQLARIFFKGETVGHSDDEQIKIRNFRKSLYIIPYVKQIDTLAAEHPAVTNYLYLTYHGSEHDLDYDETNKSVIVLGSGAYRIGSSVEFDWSGVNALQTVKKKGFRSVMINYNPETVSTDYDLSDRLYFDELSFERTMDIIELEKPHGVIVSTGGQIPNNLAGRFDKQNVKILGTQAHYIDMAENRHKFSNMLDTIGVDQPEWKELSSIDDIFMFTKKVGFPVLIRPSYVLSGAAMNVVSNKDELKHFLNLATLVSKQYPVVVSRFLENAKEIEMDAVANKGEIIVYAISEHIEFAGVHSGDATIMFPPQKVYVETIRRIKRISHRIAKELQISGPFNIQFLAKDNDIKVIECNLRASRSLPFVSKVLKTNFIDIATRIMLGEKVEKPNKSLFDIDYIGVKASQFSFSRLSKADPVLGVDMASTGEVGCLGDDYYEAILKSMLSVGHKIPKKTVLISSGPMRSKTELLESTHILIKMGFKLFATKGTSDFLLKNGINSKTVHWPDVKKSPNAFDLIKDGKIDLVINIPKTLKNSDLNNDYSIRRAAVDFNVPLITNARLASAFIYAISKYKPEDLKIKSWSEY